ncbi:isochorismate synthase [Pusillimonas sp. ANT_WB101]|uniref:isochorismate synthase n=1 Tax=Pusillimonas sp. ANT_WB101 TaxID=2597356 RepID=UPI0011EF9D9E|nr:isochorismate synthase [Pusillimonas sp. ANT_WB101]KAA0890004.1 isochorismate synthase [Pusillimonas sp. ANT_WB101]
MPTESGASEPHNTATTEPSLPARGWMLDDFARGDVFFASPATQWRSKASLGALSAIEPVSVSVIQSLFDEARQRGLTDPVMFGLVPFDTSKPASLTIPLSYECAGVPDNDTVMRSLDSDHTAKPQIVGRTPVPPPEIYGDMVRKALTLFAEGDLKKVVLSRAMDIDLDQPPNYPQLLQDLLRRNAHGYTFALPIWGDGGTSLASGVMVGASPELLVRREGDRIFINPLAGSIGRNSNPDTDAALKAGLARSEKDLREHAYVVNDIVRILHEYCDELDVPPGPSVIGTDTLWHLSTFITGQLRDPAVTALQLSCALHPTPAICGQPTGKAFEHIRQLEPFDREYFAGLVGWQRANGDGEWALTLRCAMHTEPTRLRVYAGAGTVAGSDPDSEIAETATKMETFIRALG